MMIDSAALLRELLGTNAIEMRAGALLDSEPDPLSPGLSFDRIEGMLLGLAIGDALGKMSEGMLPGDRRAMYGEIDDYLPVWFADDRRIGLPSDDTQLAFWALEQMLVDRGVHPERIAHRFAQERIYGLGGSVRAFLENLKRGSPWHEAGVASAGNGAVMRIAPVIVPHLRRPSPGLWADAALCGMITHNDSASLASCVALVRMIWSTLSFERPPDPMWWPENFVATARELETGAAYRPRGGDFLDYSGPLSGFVERYVPPVFEEGLSVRDACDRWYSGAFLLETMPSVLYILMKHGDDFEAALLRAVNDTKDNDTIAAIVGAVLGALHGKQAIPKRWLDGLVGRTGASDDGRVFELIDAAKAVWWDASPAETKAPPKEMNSIFPGFLDLVAEVHGRSPLAGSADHGDHHWRLVAWTGHTLMQQLCGVDPLVVLLFALFHDSQREKEYGDPEHGRRGAALARELLTRPRWQIDGFQLDWLVVACELHTESGPTSNATLGVCWDSDRLNLWRVGTKPDAGYLSTAPAREPERIEWAREVQRKDFTWTEIHEAYSPLPLMP